MAILGIDTSGSDGSLTLFDPKTKVFKKCHWGKESKHSEVLPLKFSELVKSTSDFSIDTISSLYAVSGPGSFTGIRVGIGFAKTLSYSFSLPVYPINALWALGLHRDCQTKVPFFSTIDAQKNSVYLSKLQWQEGTLKELFKNRICSVGTLEENIPPGSKVVGPGWERYKDFLNKDYSQTISYDPMSICLETVIRYGESHKPSKPQTWRDLQPVYIKKSAAEELRGEKN